MKIAQVAMRYLPATGGIETHLEEVSKRLADRGYSVEIFVSDLYQYHPRLARLPAGALPPDRDGVRVHRLRVSALPGLHYTVFRGMGRALARAQPHLIHSHLCDFNRTPSAWFYARSHDVPFLVDAHYYPIRSFQYSGLRGWVHAHDGGFSDRLLAGPGLAHARRVIVQSREEERLMRADGLPMPPVEILPPGRTPLPPPPEAPDAFRRAYQIPGDFVLFVGRLAWSKGLLPLVDAFRAIARRDGSATLVLVGPDEGMRARVEQRARDLALTSRIRLTGFVDDKRLLAAAFREARLFVLPSEQESFGIVLLDALAQGTPVVATAVGAIPEVIEPEKSGLLVSPGAVAPLADAMLRLWEDPEACRKMGEYGREVIAPRYTWDRHTERLVELYLKVLDG